jgi:hypothetical protein
MKTTGIKNCVYLIRCPEHAAGLVKIGLTTDLDSRMNSLNSATETPVPFDVYAVVKTDKYRQLETHLHHIYASNRTNPKREFFKFIDENGNDYIDDVIDMMAECAELVDGEFVDFRDELPEIFSNSSEKKKRFTFKAIGLKGGDEVVFNCEKFTACPVTYYVAADGRHIVDNVSDVNNRDAWIAVSTAVKEISQNPNVWGAWPDCWFYNGQNCEELFDRTLKNG